MGISQVPAGKDIGVPAMRINRIVHGERRISADTALRLACYFSMSVEFWIGIQTHYEIERQNGSRQPHRRRGRRIFSGSVDSAVFC